MTYDSRRYNKYNTMTNKQIIKFLKAAVVLCATEDCSDRLPPNDSVSVDGEALKGYIDILIDMLGEG